MKIKYPRTFHLPWSEGCTSDDKKLTTDRQFFDREVVVSEKRDGENTTMYRDYYHARSLDSAHHPSRDFVKSIWGQIRYMIPEGYRVCGENLYARHSIGYDNLSSYFEVFSIWDHNNMCLSWDDTEEFVYGLGLITVPVIYRGTYDQAKIRGLWNPEESDKVEGYVVRSAKSFHYDAFQNNVAKFVRKGHVQTDEHWMHSEITKNILKGET